ncbi:MAG: serine/threonine-protein phosphatase [Planctomycetes bacterium]|nr:serine/threonine-protein phosphatase [Planctomycetota bacterium]
MSTEDPTTIQTDEESISGSVRRIGAAEIKTMRHGDLTLFAVAGRQDAGTAEILERTFLRSRGNVAVDLRALQGFEQKIVSSLRRVARAFAEQRRVFMLYEPPSRLLDQLVLQGVLAEVTIFDSKRGLVRRSSSSAPTPEAGQAGAAAETELTDASERVIRFTQSIERAEEIESALATAGRRSRAMFKANTPEFPPYEIVSYYLPHDELGGDFFHLDCLDDDHLGISIGDVSGHGVEAALVMGMTKKVLEIRAREGSHTDPAQAIRTTNGDLFGDLDRYTFVTALYAIVERSTATLTYARAGHNYPLLVSPSQKNIFRLNGPGIALGMDGGALFNSVLKPVRETLHSGDVLVFFTDGLIEAAHPKRGPFGVERLVEYFREISTERPLEELRDSVLDTIRSFCGEARFEDDLTLILVRHGK